MFDSPHIHITTLCCFDWPVTLLSLISLHGTESDYDRAPPWDFTEFISHHFSTSQNNSFAGKKNSQTHFHTILSSHSTSSSSPVCLPLGQSFSKGGTHHHATTPLLLLIPSSAHPQTLSLIHTRRHTCLDCTLSLPAQLAKLMQC